MKFLGIFACLLLCACNNNGRHDDAYRGYEDSYQPQTYAAPVAIQQPVYAEPAPVAQPVYSEPVVAQQANPYALEPPAYEQSFNLALTQKEEELFQKEKNLMDAQQELYEREKKLADREAAFIDRSKALDYKEKSILSGRSYAPTSVNGYGRAPAPAPIAQPAPAPVPAKVYRVEPPAPYASRQPQPYFQGASDCGEEENVLDLNNYSEPADYQPIQGGYIILQHPIQRDLVRCPVTDDVCMEAYERLGYVRAENLSRFTAQDELNTAGTYPTNANGQWRENNTIPRW